eukprot:321911_1
MVNKPNKPALPIQTTYINGYWQGYDIDGDDPIPLNQVSDKINDITIAFINPINKKGEQLATTWKFMDAFRYSEKQIKQWVQDINKRKNGQKVLFSIYDSPDFHWYPDVDIEKFVKSLANTVNQWGLGGINIDAESGMIDPENNYVQTFVQLIKTLRKYLSDDKIITYTCYNSNSYHELILKQCANDIEYVDTMNYWYDMSGQLIIYNLYANAIGDYNKIGIGVKAGNQNPGDQSTTIDTVKECAKWLSSNNKITKKRMMLWAISRDNQKVTNKPDESYLNAIYDNLQSYTYNAHKPIDILSFSDAKTIDENVLNARWRNDYDNHIDWNLLNMIGIVFLVITCVIKWWLCWCSRSDYHYTYVKDQLQDT